MPSSRRSLRLSGFMAVVLAIAGTSTMTQASVTSHGGGCSGTGAGRNPNVNICISFSDVTVFPSISTTGSGPSGCVVFPKLYYDGELTSVGPLTRCSARHIVGLAAVFTRGRYFAVVDVYPNGYFHSDRTAYSQRSPTLYQP
jgi:hypothetical protein